MLTDPFFRGLYKSIWFVLLAVGGLVRRVMGVSNYNSQSGTIRPEILEHTAPSKFIVDMLTLPFRWLNPPKVDGFDEIRSLIANGTRVMFIGNHTVMGFATPVIHREIYNMPGGVFLRVIYDPTQCVLPFWRSFLDVCCGGVAGTKKNCEALMEAGLPVLVYPGGGREALKLASDQKYSLMWRGRSGFARLALKHGYTVIPVSAVGMEDALHIIEDVTWDHNGLACPVLAPCNTLERQYFLLGRPIASSDYIRRYEQQRAEAEARRRRRALGVGGGVGGGESDSSAAAWSESSVDNLYSRSERRMGVRRRRKGGQERERVEGWESTRVCNALREDVERQVQSGIKQLQLRRRSDPQRWVVARLLVQLPVMGPSLHGVLMWWWAGGGGGSGDVGGVGGSQCR